MESVAREVKPLTFLSVTLAGLCAVLCAWRGAEADHGRPLGARGLRARHHRGRLPGPETQGARQHRPHDRGQAQTGAYVTRLVELMSILSGVFLIKVDY